MIRLLTACLALTLLVVPVAHAQSRKPLLIDGKTELFQRILTRPGASIAQGVGAPGAKALEPFTPLYVYQRHPADGGGQTYLEVGTDAKGTIVGFLPEPETVPWRHALVLAFSERVNRERALFFRERSGLAGHAEGKGTRWCGCCGPDGDRRGKGPGRRTNYIGRAGNARRF